jgi:hypothetical protein
MRSLTIEQHYLSVMLQPVVVGETTVAIVNERCHPGGTTYEKNWT